MSSFSWSWYFTCLRGADQKCILSHTFILHLWNMLIDIYRHVQGFLHLSNLHDYQ